MGAIDELFDFAKSKVQQIPVVGGLFGADEKPQSPSGGMEPTRGIEGGFPFVNYAFNDRVAATKPLVIPRYKYTFIVEFHINQQALQAGRRVTNLHTFVNNGKLYINLKQIDHPKPSLAVDTLRSYNRYVKLPTKVEFQPATMTFDDDATSMAASLMKEYMAFYSWSGTVGYDDGIVQPNLTGQFYNDDFSYDAPNVGYNHLVSSDADQEPRRNMSIRGSMGMRLKPNYMRTFFDTIVIYDLGTEPDSVNVYYFYKPTITAFNHNDLDKEDRTSKVEISMNFDYENYYSIVGQNRMLVADIIEKQLGSRPPETRVDDGVSQEHGDMDEIYFNESVPVSIAYPEPQPPVPATDPPTELQPLDPVEGALLTTGTRDPQEIQRQIDEANQMAEDILTSENLTPEQKAELTEALASDIDELKSELNEANIERTNLRTRERLGLTTQEALSNTEAQLLDEQFQRLDENNQRIGELTTEEANLQQELEDEESSFFPDQDKIDELNSKLADNRSEQQVVNMERTDAANQLQDLAPEPAPPRDRSLTQEEIGIIDRQTEKLQGNVDRLERQIEYLDTRIEETRAMLEDDETVTTASADELSAELTRLQRQRAVQQRELNQVNSQIDRNIDEIATGITSVDSEYDGTIRL